MPTNNQLVELTKLIGDKESMESDFSDIFLTLRDMLHKKYISKLYSVVDTQEKQVKEHPPKEIALLRALREFTPDTGRGNFDRMIDMAMMMNTAQSMQSDLHSITQQSNQLHTMSDGKEIDDTIQNSASVAGILLTLALMKVI